MVNQRKKVILFSLSREKIAVHFPFFFLLVCVFCAVAALGEVF